MRWAMPERAPDDSADSPLGSLAAPREARETDQASVVASRASLGLAAAVAAHLLVIGIAAGGLDAIAAAILGRPFTGAAAKRVGDRSGTPDGIAAEVIDAREFDKKYMSFKAGRDEADSNARPTAPKTASAEPNPRTPQPQAPATPEKKTAPEAKTEDVDAGDGYLKPKADPAPPQPEKPSPRAREAPPPKPAAKPTLNERDIADLLESTMDEITGSVVATAKAGAARLGEASPFVRAVVRKLKATMPHGVASKGSVVIRFMVGPDGKVQAIRIVRSSGRPALDSLIVQRVAATPLMPPPSNVSSRERVFQITYEYR